MPTITIYKAEDSCPEEWNVEMIDTTDGECHVNAFSGGNAKERAFFFAKNFYTCDKKHRLDLQCPNIINEHSIEILTRRIEKAKKGAV